MCFAKGPVACQTRKILLLLAEGKKRVRGYESTSLHGKHVEVLGQAVVFSCQKREGSQAICFHESYSQVWRQRFWRSTSLLAGDNGSCCLPTANESKRQIGFSFLWSCFIQVDEIVGFSLLWTWYCRGFFCTANFPLKPFSDYKCVMISVSSVIHSH